MGLKKFCLPWENLTDKARLWQGNEVEKLEIAFYGLIVAVEMICIIKNSIIVVSTNFILGFFFGMRAWKQAKKAAKMRAESSRKWILPMLDAILACCLGIIAVGAFNNIKTEHILVAGTCLTIYGMTEIGKQMYLNAICQ